MSSMQKQREKGWDLYHHPKNETVPGLREAGRFMLQHARPQIHPHVHEHGRLEICFVEDGRHRDTVNGRTYLLHKGQALVVRPGDRHGHINVAQEPCRGSFLILDVSAARSVFLGFRGAEARRIRKALLDIETPCFPFSSLAVELWQATMEAIHRLDQSIADASSVETVRVYLSSLLAALIESSQIHTRVQPFTLSHRVDQFVDAHPDRRVSVVELARACHMSESCFQARFKKETGLSLINYALRRKMDVAKARLTASDDPITRIALDLGFSSSQNFATTFKRIAGRPPTKYRLDTKEAGETPHPAT